MPEPAKGDKPAEREKRPTRIEIAEKRGESHAMPPLDPDIAYLYETLMDAGPAKSGGMGVTSIDWIDLQAWERGSGIELQPWESRLIRRLSAAYVAESRRAEEHDARPPWEHELPAKTRQVLAVRDAFRARAAR